MSLMSSSMIVPSLIAAATSSGVTRPILFFCAALHSLNILYSDARTHRKKKMADRPLGFFD